MYGSSGLDHFQAEKCVVKSEERSAAMKKAHAPRVSRQVIIYVNKCVLCAAEGLLERTHRRTRAASLILNSVGLPIYSDLIAVSLAALSMMPADESIASRNAY